jgi:hypothetical protein
LVFFAYVIFIGVLPSLSMLVKLVSPVKYSSFFNKAASCDLLPKKRGPGGKGTGRFSTLFTGIHQIFPFAKIVDSKPAYERHFGSVVRSSLLTVYFGAPSMFITLWFGFDYGTNPPLGTLII